MSPTLVLTVVFGYFVLLLGISWATSRNSNAASFFNANRSSPWFLVAFGMIGATLSGVTFISVPGEVGNTSFSYLQFVAGNVVGYWLIALVLLPLYYRLNLLSIYGYLNARLGWHAYKTGAFFFLLSKLIGAAFRLYLVALVLQLAFFDALSVPFWATVCISVLLIWLYTYRSGIKTIVWTDTLQTLLLVLAVAFTIFQVSEQMQWSLSALVQQVTDSPYSTTFFEEWRSPQFFPKQFFAGIFMTIVIVGMDQDMMQKNLTCRNLSEARKNMLLFSLMFLVVVFLFLNLGAMLYLFAEKSGIPIPSNSDQLYPLLAMNHLGIATGIAFLLGITAAAFSSADSALTAMTTSFCVDFLQMDSSPSAQQIRQRKQVHFLFSVLLIIVILLFKAINNESVVVAVFKAASYTYGPILGLFLFALTNQLQVDGRKIPFVAISTPIICFGTAHLSPLIFNGYQFGFELLILNAALTYLGLWFFRK